ncbi:MAG: hypothetical protein ABI569_16835 [Casimicrobiaceae bacterium]
MEKADTRLLEEWKANLDLLKFYETLKQQRFAHFLTIQTAFLAIFGLLAKEAIGVFSLVALATLVVVPIAPLFLAYYFMRLDARGRAFVDTANTRLLLIEDEWKAQFPGNHFSTCRQQFSVLSRRDDQFVPKYLAIRNVADDSYETLIKAPSAHASEAAILRLFWWLWVIVFSFSFLHLIWHLAHPGWRPG